MRNKKAQLKIQQMAFVLVAMVIFFALVALAYFSLRINSLKESASTMEQENTKEMVLRLTGLPEFKYSDCSSCIDLDKAMLIKNRTTYSGFFSLDYLAFEVISPQRPSKECVVGNYPDCSKITITEKPNYGIEEKAFVALCRYDQTISSEKCELGLIKVASNSIKQAK